MEVKLTTSNDTIIKAVLIFAEGIFEVREAKARMRSKEVGVDDGDDDDDVDDDDIDDEALEKIRLIMMRTILIMITMLTTKKTPPPLMMTFSQRRGGLLQHRATTDHFRGRNRSCQGAPEPLNPRIRSCQENQGNRHCSNNNNSHKEARHRNQCSH